MASNDVDVRLLLDIKDATKAIEGFTSQLKALGAIAAAAFASAKVAQFISEIVHESSLAEDAIQGFNTALALAGNFSAQASKDFRDFASQVQKVSKFSDEAVLNAGALIEQLTQLDEQGLKRATQASIDLASALRIDLDTASRLVGKAAEGNVESFKRYGIQIQKGASDTETFANTLKALETRFGGAAAAAGNTFSGAMEILGNAVSDVKESLGNIITQNPAVILGIQAVTKIFQAFGDLVKKNEDAIVEFVNKGVALFLKGLKLMVDGLVLANNLFEKFKVAVLTLGRGTAKQSEFLTDLKIKTDEIVDTTIKRIEVEQKQHKQFESNIKKAIKLTKELSNEEQKANVSKLAANPALAITGGGGLVGGASAGQQSQQNIAAAVGTVGEVVQGMQGAVKLASGLVSGFVDTLLPGLGAVAGQIFSVLAKGPDEVRKMVTEFIKAIPTILINVIASIPAAIEAIIQSLPDLVSGLIFGIIEKIPDIIIGFIENLPTLIEELAVRLDEIFQRLIERAPEIIAKIIEALPKLMEVLQVQLPIIAAKFAVALAAQAPFIAIQMGTAFIKEIPHIAAELAKGIVDAIKSLIGGAGGVVSSAGKGIGSGIGSIGKIFGFAEGGLVGPGFPNDSAIARLSSGEFVSNADLTKKMMDFFSGAQGSGQNLTVNLVIGESQLASAILNLNQRGFRTV